MTSSKVSLLVLALLGFWTLWVFPYQNGLLKILGHQTEPGAVIPGPTIAPMKQTYTGIRPVDNQLTVLVSFFYTAIDGNRADISLSFLALGSQVLGLWVLIMVESLRNAHHGMFFLTATTLLGLGVAVIGYACVTPLWFILHLWTSPTVVRPKADHLLVNIPIMLAIIPFSISIGFGLPSVLMTLPAPSFITFETKQIFAAIQQGWALWIGISQFSLSTLAMILDPAASVLDEEEKRVKTIKYLRRVYLFSILSSSVPHLAGLSLSLLAYAFPVLFSPTYLPQLQPQQVYWPVNPFSSQQVRTLPEGALWFLQWDLIVAVAANLVWGMSVGASGREQRSTTAQTLIGLGQTVITTLVLGPSAAVAFSLWTRDELVFRSSTAVGKKYQ
ncbi:hypothetical protein B0A52_05861 [Exophiala mesophila]|uniref:Uncharacterized protein n=1 Tax=Exophiala mesophila TaxID=212818 RepID=A0A438N3M5_EXOME|nr:hypothetical protein B0A52_05861 [Exophiala mesophila]